MSPTRNILVLHYAPTRTLLFLILFMIPVASPAAVGGSGGFLQTGYISENFDVHGSPFFYAASTYFYDLHSRIEKALTTTAYFNYFHPTTNHDAATYTYDKAGNLVLIETDSDATSVVGTVHYHSTTTVTNLSDYQTYKVTSVESLPDETVDGVYSEIETFDEQRNLIRDQYDFDNNSTMDLAVFTTWEYDPENHRIYQADGVVFNGVDLVLKRTTYVTDDRGNAISFESRDPLGAIDKIGTFTYDKFGNLVQVTIEPGDPFRLDFTTKQSYSYLHRGEVIGDSNPGAATRALPQRDSLRSNPADLRRLQHR